MSQRGGRPTAAPMGGGENMFPIRGQNTRLEDCSLKTLFHENKFKLRKIFFQPFCPSTFPFFDSKLNP